MICAVYLYDDSFRYNYTNGKALLSFPIKFKFFNNRFFHFKGQYRLIIDNI